MGTDLPDRLVGAWLGWMLAMSWQAAVLVAALACICVVARRMSPRFRYCLWGLVLLKLCLPPTFAFPTGLGYWVSLDRAPFAVEEFQSARTPSGGRSGPDEPAMVPSPTALELAESGGVHPPPPGGTGHSGGTDFPWLQALLAAWIGGMGVLAATGLLMFLKMRQTLQSASPVTAPRILTSFREARRVLGVKHDVPILSQTGLSSPILVGLFRPRIILPAEVVADLPDDQVEPILLHELAHFQRRDLFINFIQAILQVIYWFHPFVWFANMRLRFERELIVDDVVLLHLGEGGAYGESLLSVLKRSTEAWAPALNYLGILETDSGIARRIRRIMDAKRVLSVRLTWYSAVLLMVVALLMIPMAGSQEQPAAPLVATEEARSLLGEGVAKWRAGDADGAIEIFNEVLKKYPRDNWAGCAVGQIAEIRWRQQKYDEAIEACQKALREYPQVRYGNGNPVGGVAAFLMAMSYYKKGDKERAEAVYRQMVQQYPDAFAADTGRPLADVFPLRIRAEERKKGGEMPGTDEALRLFSAAINQQKAGNAEEYERLLRELIEKYPKDNWAGCAVGQLAFLKKDQQKYEEAIELFERVLREYPLARYGHGKTAASFAAYFLAICYHKIGEKDKAMEAFDQAVEKYPDACTGDGDQGKPLRDVFLETIQRDKKP
ncbi:MAG: M56 family metallopeptidase [Planctomycetota bacterium]